MLKYATEPSGLHISLTQRQISSATIHRHGSQRVPPVELARGNDRRDRGCHGLRCALFAEQHAAALDRDGDRTRGGGYYEIGKQYQELLARNGVKLRLVATLGSVI
jgi:hypothetical protein